MLDQNQDGKLSRDELIKGYRDILYHPNPEKEVDRLFSIMDYNKDGFIDYTEFCLEATNTVTLFSEKNIQKAF
jgi:calcium-dependent protein kinase